MPGCSIRPIRRTRIGLVVQVRLTTPQEIECAHSRRSRMSNASSFRGSGHAPGTVHDVNAMSTTLAARWRSCRPLHARGFSPILRGEFDQGRRCVARGSGRQSVGHRCVIAVGTNDAGHRRVAAGVGSASIENAAAARANDASEAHRMLGMVT